MPGLLSTTYPYHPDAPENAYAFAPTVHTDQVALAFGSRGLPKLVALLMNDAISDEKRVETLLLLHGILSTQETKLSAVRHGALAACSELLNSQSSPDVRAGAASVIASLVLVLQARKQASEAVVPLTALLEDSATVARVAASLAVKNLALFQDGCALLTSTPNTISKLVFAALDKANPDAEPSAEVTLNLVAALADITRYPSGRAQALQAGCVEQLLSAVQSVHNPGILGHFVVAVWNIAQSADGKAQAIEGGAVAAVAAGLDNADPEVRRSAAGALSAISVDERGKYAVQDTDGVVQGLAAALLDDIADVRANAAAAIRTASENPKVLRTFVEVLVPMTENLEMVYGKVGAAEPCVELLVSGKRADAARALRSMSETEAGCAAVLGGLYAVERLAALTMDGSAKTEDDACAALSNLCSSSRGAKRRLLKFADEPGNETARQRLEIAGII